MNKIINKALFYKEWINVKYFTILSILVLLCFKVGEVLSLLNTNKYHMRHYGKIYTDRWFNNGLFSNEDYYGVMVFIVIILATILFLGEKKSETQGFIISMPFTRKEIIINKWIVGVVSILISFAVTYIALSLIYVVNLNAIDTALNPYSDIVKWFFMDVFEYICIFSFIMLVQTVMGNSIVSSIVGGVMFLVPWFIITIVQEIVYRITQYSYQNSLMVTIREIGYWLSIYRYNFTEEQWYYVKDNYDNMRRVCYYTNYELKMGILFILTLVFLYLLCVFYQKRDLEYNLRLFNFKKIETIFICGFSICSGLLLGAILGFGAFSSDGLRAFWICTVIGLIVGYFVSRILVKLFSTSK